MRRCGFCNGLIGLGGLDRSKEHVFREKWLRELGCFHVPSAGVHLERHGSDHLRKLLPRRTPGGIIAGAVCEPCNTGWMERADDRVDVALLSLARGVVSIESLSAEHRRNLSLWLLKTAHAFELTKPESNRFHLPRTVLDQLRIHDRLPSGWSVFAAINPKAQGFGVESSVLGVQSENSDGATGVGYKIAVQYQKLHIGGYYFPGDYFIEINRHVISPVHENGLPIRLRSEIHDNYSEAKIPYEPNDIQSVSLFMKFTRIGPFA